MIDQVIAVGVAALLVGSAVWIAGRMLLRDQAARAFVLTFIAAAIGLFAFRRWGRGGRQ